ncbi:MAG: glycosyltransferase family 4 protein [Bacteroidia bacterium]|nr:glycosyltransferase family 4 protein [Bacteroidia bacterium]NND25091.1 glycosyltransferase family 4 protein [Flavobacteriaceae bacterium]NNK59355.1 glycosyltransferase family 4 protein [Flavobacteriaceae bacterium]RZW57820.1 MAG: glycosyltransferase [Flavobacteriaceae bacterium]
MIKVLIIGAVWPEPRSSAAGGHMMQLISLFDKTSYQLTFASSSTTSENAVALSDHGIDEVEIELNDSSFDDFIQNLDPQVVIFDRFISEEQFGWRVLEKCPKALRVLNTEDLHGLRKARELAFNNEEEITTKHLLNDISKREIASIFRSDLSLIISEFEMELLLSTFKVEKNLLFYLPFLVDHIDEPNIEDLPTFEKRLHFVTIGNFLHKPNLDAVSLLKHEIWPLIHKAIPKSEMHIYGAYMPEKLKQWHDPRSNFYMKGFAENVDDVMRNAKVCLAPLRFGAGLKGKLVDAMISGTPCVTTTIGAEGLSGNLDMNGIITDDVNAFARMAVELYENQELWKEKQRNGFKIINKRFQKRNFQNDFISTMNSLLNNIDDHRTQNVIGTLFHHHSMQSTKYLSKWIEEKNK